MKSLMILLATMAMTMVAVQAEIVHPAVEKAAIESETPMPTEVETNTTTQDVEN